jgi:hypothetical protein
LRIWAEELILTLFKTMLRFLLATIFLSLFSSAGAQGRMKLVCGNFGDLVFEEKIKLEFSFDSMKVAKYRTEKEFIEARKEKLNKDEPGKGNKWEEAWIKKRESYFGQKFGDLFLKYSELEQDDHAVYILIFKTVKLDPGFDGEVGKPYSYLTGDAILTRSDQPGKVIARMQIIEFKGESFIADITGGTRIGESYAIAGRTFGKYIGKVRKGKS